MSISPSPAQYSCKEMNRAIELIDKAPLYSRKSSMGVSEDDMYSATDYKISRKFTTKKIVAAPQQKKQISMVAKIVQNIYFQVFITLLTLASLVLYDIKTIFLTKDADYDVGIVTLAFFGVFMIEIIMNFKTQGYFCSFYFFLDLISTITLLLDVDMFTDAIFNQGSSSGFQVNSLIAQSKASRAAARAVRVVKIFRLARVAKLYKSTQRARELNQLRKKDIKHPILQKHASDEQQSQPELAQTQPIKKQSPQLMRYQIQQDSIKQQQQINYSSHKSKHSKLKQSSLGLSSHHKSKLQLEGSASVKKQMEEQEIQSKESNISKILSDDTIKRIIIVILVLMVSIPLMDLNNYVTLTNQWDFMTSLLHKIMKNPQVPVQSINQIVSNHVRVYSDILCIDTPFNQIEACLVSDLSDLRSNDIGYFFQNINATQILALRTDITLKSNQSTDSIVVFVSYSHYNRIDAIFSIVTTIFICLTIMYLLTSFSGNINELVISPIEKMLSLIKSSHSEQPDDCQSKDKKQQYQTQMVQNAIIKIKNLMQTIFGSLGNQLIYGKMQNNRAIRNNLNESKQNSLCVFVRCQINNLDVITQVLGDDVFGFVNQISMLAQNSAYRYGGYCTKVIDNGFLMTFKVPKEKWQECGVIQDMAANKISRQLAPEDNSHIRIMCDYSLFSVVKILARLCKEPKIFKYRNDQRLLVSFKGVFNVEMSFALTFGWASEGIVGSSYKIDPIFFGKQFNRLKKLIRITKNRGNSIVLSESLFANLTVGAKGYCRPYDCVRMKDQQKPQKIYLVDFDTMNVTPSRHRGQKQKKVSKDLKTKKEQNLAYLEQLQMALYEAKLFVGSKKELREILKKKISEESCAKYRSAFDSYLKGQWQLSMDILDYEKLSGDVLSQRLRQIMRVQRGIKPVGWKGYRQYDDVIRE